MKLSQVAASVSGIQNFSKMKDKDKAYLIKLVGTIIAAFISGIISGVFYEQDGTFDAQASGRLGFLIWFVTSYGLGYFVKKKYDLEPITNWQAFRIAIFVGFFNFIFWWAVVFNFIIF